MRLEKLFKGIGLKPGSYTPDMDVTSIATNSKDVKRGSLFVAIEGFLEDGHKFVKEAFKNGARISLVTKQIKGIAKSEKLIRVRDTKKALSIIARNFHDSPSEKLKVIGVTGTDGKTTTSFLVESIFNKAHIPCGRIGTIDYRLGKSRIPAERTTPDALTVNRLLSKMIKQGMKRAVMEVSSHALRQKRVRDILFDAAIFTNLTREHLDYHGTMERYFASKLKIFSNLKKKGVAIINADDKRAKRIKKTLSCKKITYGLKEPADVSARVEKISLDGSSVVIKIHRRDAFSLDTKLVGLHNISNILAASALGFSQGLSLRAIKEGIENVETIKGRLEAVTTAKGFKVFVDYAHTHNALERVLKFLREMNRGRIITVFGCGGDRDRGKRPLMGAVSQKFSDFVVITNDNPRTEDPGEIARDIEGGMNKQSRNYAVILDRRKAIERAFWEARPGDVVLLAGKGHETEQIIGRRRIAFDERKVAEEILNRPHRISIDSRTTKRNDTFIAIKGGRFDGHDFVREAFKKGAARAIISRDVKLPSQYKDRALKVKDTIETLGAIAKAHRLRFNIPVVAITGTNGKTTAKDMAAFVLSANCKVLKNETSKNNLIGLPLTLLGLDKTHQMAVLEMGMNHRGEIDKLSEIAMPQIGVVTNIGPSHLEFLGTLENVFMAKSELLKRLSRESTAVLNRDDPYLRNIKGLKCKKIYFGIEKKCRFQARNLRYKGNRWFFSVREYSAPGGSVFPPPDCLGKPLLSNPGVEKHRIFELPLLGKHNVYNALTAIAVARHFGMGFPTIIQRLKSYRQAPPMRLEFKSVGGLQILDDSYNSNPLSMECALEALKDFDTKGKRIVVSGDMLELGKPAKAMHESIGRLIGDSPIDILITMGSLSEFTNKTAGQKGKNFYHAESHGDAARFLKKIAKPGDVVLVKGSRAMEMEKVIEGLER